MERKQRQEPPTTATGREIKVGLGLTRQKVLESVRRQPKAMRKLAGLPPRDS